MLLYIDPESTEPIYLQMRRQIILGLAHGELKFGEQLPSVRTMASEIGINAMTVAKAYAQLKDEGYLVTNRQTGTHIAEFIPMTENFEADFTAQLNLLLADYLNHGQSAASLRPLITDLLETFDKGEPTHE